MEIATTITIVHGTGTLKHVVENTSIYNSMSFLCVKSIYTNIYKTLLKV